MKTITFNIPDARDLGNGVRDTAKSAGNGIRTARTKLAGWIVPRDVTISKRANPPNGKKKRATKKKVAKR